MKPGEVAKLTLQLAKIHRTYTDKPQLVLMCRLGLTLVCLAAWSLCSGAGDGRGGEV